MGVSALSTFRTIATLLKHDTAAGAGEIVGKRFSTSERSRNNSSSRRMRSDIKSSQLLAHRVDSSSLA